MLSKEDVFLLLDYEPHEGQKKLHTMMDNYRFVTATCGRRFGKSTAAAAEVIYHAITYSDDKGPALVFVVSDTYDNAKLVFEPVVDAFYGPLRPFLLPDNPTKQEQDEAYSKRDRTIKLLNGARIMAKTADSPRSLVGRNPSLVVNDESQNIGDDAIRLVLPAVREREGQMLSIGTPEMFAGWYYSLFEKGLGDSEDYISLQLPSDWNPHGFSKTELEKIREETPETDYRIQYLAEWLEADSSTFPETMWKECVTLDHYQPPISGRKYVAGLDLGDRNDFTVLTIVDVSQEPYQVALVERWKGDGYEAKATKVAQLCRDYNFARLYVEENSALYGFQEMLIKEYANFQTIWTSQSSKMKWVDNLQALFMRKAIHLYTHNQLFSELRSFQRKQTKNGISYAAAPGFHDDMVMSLLLAAQAVEGRTVLPVNHEFESWSAGAW